VRTNRPYVYLSRGALEAHLLVFDDLRANGRAGILENDKVRSCFPQGLMQSEGLEMYREVTI